MSPQLRSLSWQTDLILLDTSIVTDRGEYIVVRTPERRGFWWGNFLLFRKEPHPGDLERWTGLFRQEIASLQPTRHVALGWDAPDGNPGDTPEFTDHGFTFERSTVLTTTELLPPYPTLPDYTVRPIDSDADWDQVVENQVLLRDPRFSEEDYRGFCTGRREDYRRIIGKGLGMWFGAFEGGKLLGDLGIFGRDGVARYQWVETHPDHRRRGVAGNLIHAAGLWGGEHLGATSFVIVTEPDSTAERLYRRCGFRSREWQLTLERGE